MNFKKIKPIYIYLALILFATILIMIFSMCSPLFYTNTWADANAFLTMGNGIKHGLVPYRDLFEQKGPLLYMMHAINCIITPNQFWTIAVFEVIALSISLIFIYKIAKLYLNDYLALIVTIFYPVFLLPWRLFQTGDSAEEFVLPFIFISLFIIIKRFRDNFAFTKQDFLFLGIFTGIALWIKFTLLGFWIGFYLGGLVYSMKHKNWLLLKNALLYSFLGVIIASLPILLYFALNGALFELWDVYFLFNMKAYPSQNSLPAIVDFIWKLFSVVGFSLYFLVLNYVPAIFIAIGCSAVLLTKTFFQTWLEKSWWFSTAFFTIFIAYYGLKAYTYYFLIVLPFTIFGLIFLCKIVMDKLPKLEHSLNKVPALIFIVLLCVTSTYLVRQDNGNIGESKLFNKNIPIQQIYAEIMHENVENPTMLNYGALDFGFYNAADILPTIRFFENQNVDYDVYPDIIDGQNEAIANRLIDFVIVCDGFDTDVDYQLLEKHYDLIRHEQSFGAGPGAYFRLYQVKK